MSKVRTLMSRKNPTGVLPSQFIKQLLRTSFIAGVDEEFVNPASLDLPLSEEVYRLEGTLLPQGKEKVRSLIKKVGGVPYDLKNPLEVGVSYLIKVEGSYVLPDSVYGYVNPKSSTGRINLFCRVVADQVDIYDALTPPGWAGELWVLVRPESFPVRLPPGKAVSQLRLFDGPTFLDNIELDLAIQDSGIFFHPTGNQFGAKKIRRHRDSLFLSLNLTAEEDGVVGWECRGVSKVLDYGINTHEVKDFFTEIRVPEGDHLIIRKGSFYILSTYEHVLVPPQLSAELRATDPRFGEYRSHAAGYIDPGWGWGIDGSARGRPITLEVTPYETAMVRHRQAVARIRYEHMKEEPDVPYDGAKSNYTKQNVGPALSKHFRK